MISWTPRARGAVFEWMAVPTLLLICVSTGTAQAPVVGPEGEVTVEEIASTFASPPTSYGPYTWWHWMNGNVTREGITADLEAMKRVGIAGLQVFEVGQGIPQGPIEYLSPEWAELMRYAIGEADRLGLEFDIHNCPGWSSSGGPWITPEYAMQILVWSETSIEGGRRVEIDLPQPRTYLDYYRDAFVLAFPAPGGPEMHHVLSAVTANTGPLETSVLRGDAATTHILMTPDGEEPAWLLLEFETPFLVRSVTVESEPVQEIRGRRGIDPENQLTLEVSDDGETFRAMATIPPGPRRSRGGRGGIGAPSTVNLMPTSARYFRLLSPNARNVYDFELSPDARIVDWPIKANYSQRGRGRNLNPQSEGTPPEGPAIDPESVLDLSRFMNADGTLAWDAPEGEWTVLRFGHTPGENENVAAPSTGEGLECDKFSAEAMVFHFNQMFGPVLSALGPLAERGLAGALVDSYEAGAQNWTAGLPDAFESRRGYDPRPWLPAMTGRVVGDAERSDRFLWDMRRTHADLMLENYYGAFTELCHENGLIAYNEPYDPGMFEQLPVGRMADIPVGEFWQGNPPNPSVELVASAGHIYGKPVIAAESFTSRSRWTEYPFNLKSLGDYVFTLGLNRYIFHRFAHQPNTQPNVVPGMTMGPWGGFFDRTNTWWPQAHAWMDYIRRCQYLLRQGTFVADVAYFTGFDIPDSTLLRENFDPPLPEGYRADTISAEVLLERATMRDGLLAVPNGPAYSVLVLPPAPRVMTPELLRRLRDFTREGLTLVGPPPLRSPGLANHESADAEIKELATELWADVDGESRTGRRYYEGKILWGAPMTDAFFPRNITPDFAYTAETEDAEINFIHRRGPDYDLYFVANRQYRSEQVECTFRVQGRRPEIWDAATGRQLPAPVYRVDVNHHVYGHMSIQADVPYHTDDRYAPASLTTVPLQLDPAGSVFVIFRDADTPTHVQTVSFNGQVIIPSSESSQDVPTDEQTVEIDTIGGSGVPLGPLAPAPPAVSLADPAAPGSLLLWRNGDIALTTGEHGIAHDVTRLTVDSLPAPKPVSGPWRIAFQADRGAPGAITIDTLASWTAHPEAGVKFFSGTAAYTKELTIEPEFLAEGRRLFLDLGRVMVIAEVALNGQQLGVLWKSPYRVDITAAARAGANALEVRVTNLWPNRIIGDEQRPPDYAYNVRSSRRGRSQGPIVEFPEWYIRNEPKPLSQRVSFPAYQYYNADSELLESGLIGPATLRPAQVYDL